VLAARAAVVVVAIGLVHHAVYTIPFAYSEIPGIQKNPAVQSLGAFAERMLTPKGLLQRPLSVLSYAIDRTLWGDDVRGFHLTNVAVHAMNGVLVTAIAAGFFAAPLLAGLVFALHPLATACVGQLFGRNYSLATTFMLVALLLFLRWRARGALGPRQLAALGVLFVLVVLTKQSLVVFPLVLAWIEVGRRGLGVADALRGLVASPRAMAAAGVVAAIGLALVVGYALPLSRTAPIGPGTFALSQLGNALVVGGFYVLPYRTALLHDLPFFDDPWHAEVWAGAALVATLAVLAYRLRARPAGWLLGAILVLLVPTNTVLPKNEVVREWRLYPTLPFFALLVATAVAALAARVRRGPRGAARAGVLRGAVALWLATFAHTDVRQNRVYQTAVGTWRQVLARYPGSADAMNNLGLHHFLDGDAAAAVRFFRMAARAAPEVYLYRENLARAYWASGERQRALRQSARAKRVFRRHGRRTMQLRVR
jgi:hypothetical protein